MTRQQDSISINDLDPAGAQIMDAAKDQMLLTAVGMAGGRLEIPVELLDEYPKGRGLTIGPNDEQTALVLELVETPNTVIDLPE